MGVSWTPSESEVKWKVRISAAGQKPDPDVVWECLRLPNCAAQTHCCITYSLNQWLFYILYLPATMLDWAGTELQELLQRHGSGDTDLAPQPAASRPMCLGAPLLLARGGVTPSFHSQSLALACFGKVLPSGSPNNARRRKTSSGCRPRQKPVNA